MPVARFIFTRRSDGDFSIGGDAAALAARRSEVAEGEWTWLHQVHGADVVVVEAPGQHAGTAADGAVTAQPGAVLAVHTADCAPLLLYDRRAGVVGAAHAGWRGLAGGVVEETVHAMTKLGATDIKAVMGAHIRARCYEFGAPELDRVAARYGDGVRCTTGWGTPALDLSAAVRTALEGCPTDVDIEDVGGCTACEPERYYSHRARADTGRHAALISLLP